MPRLAACFSISFSNSRWTGTVEVTSNSASGALVSNSVKSWLSQNSPIFSSASAFEMLLSLFSAIGFALLVAHVASADDDGGFAGRFVNEKDRKISASQRLTKSCVHIFAGGMPALRKANARLTEEELSGFAKRDMML